MIRNHRVRGMTVACIVAAVIAACSESSRESRLPTTPNPPTGGTPILFRITVTGPMTVHIGETAQYTATGHYSDTSTRDVTTEAAWASPSATLENLGNGRYAGRSAGFATVSAGLMGRQAGLSSLIVVPPGTYRLSGTVRDSGLRIDTGVTIEDVQGQRTVQTSDGFYSVFGVAGDTRITIARDGYLPQTKQVAMDSHRVVDFALEPATPRSDLSGRYELTVTAAAECTALPSDAQSRSYMATATQTGPSLAVRLDGDFLRLGGGTFNQFSGFVEPNRVTLRIWPSIANYYYFPDLVEIVAPNSYHSFDGQVSAPIGGTISAHLNGSIVRFTGPPYRNVSSCTSQLHQFLMVKQP